MVKSENHPTYIYLQYTFIINVSFLFQCTWMGGSQENVICMKNDVECILAGPEDSNYSFYLQASLSDIYQLLTEARHPKNPGKLRFSDRLKNQLDCIIRF
jgi:hypothetical protein